jgi:hypothetical protein
MGQAMQTRILGRTGLEVSEIGLGTELLQRAGREVVAEVIGEAIDRGVSYFDCLVPHPDYRDHLGAAFRGRRDGLVLAGHLGAVISNGQWAQTRDDSALAERYFLDLLRRFGTDHVEVAMIQNVDKLEDYQRIMAPGSIYDLAKRLQREGKARFVGLSGHTPSTARVAAESGLFDVLMHGANLIWSLEGLGELCRGRGVGLVIMKPFGGGELFYPPYSGFVTPVKAISHVLRQEGVCTTVPGVKDLGELRAVLDYLGASREERDASGIVANLPRLARGNCTYCQHCLPCPAEIPIHDVIHALRAFGRDPELGRQWYEPLRGMALRCTECGQCAERCPFGVDAPAQLKEAIRVFEEGRG